VLEDEYEDDDADQDFTLPIVIVRLLVLVLGFSPIRRITQMARTCIATEIGDQEAAARHLTPETYFKAESNYSGGGTSSEPESVGSISALYFSGLRSDPETDTSGKNSLNAIP
jgi:hypothetical protein